MSNLSSNSVPVGYGTIGGLLLTVACIAGGVCLLLLGKTPTEKAAGKELLSQAVPITGAATVLMRGIQARPSSSPAVEDPQPRPLADLVELPPIAPAADPAPAGEVVDESPTPAA